MAQITISPGTSDLGTITSDIQYTVTSDTTGTLTASIVVNGAQFAQQSLSSGVSSTISVMQLPTGSGTIILTATLVESVGATTTQSVTWTYNKTPINFNNSGSVASLAINGENILPTTLSEAVRTSPVWGGSLDLALQKLSNAAFYETVTPTAQLGSLAEGSIIYLNENGSPVEFYVAKQNYEPTYNTDRVLVVRKDVYDQRQWNSSSVNAWATSSMRSWLNNAYKGLLDSDVQEAMDTTTYRYTPGNGNRNVSTRSDSVFLLSATELGKSESWFNVEGTTLPNAANYQIAKLNGSTVVQWTRSPNTNSTTATTYLNANGVVDNGVCTFTYGSRPAFTLPTTFMASLETTPGLYDIQNNLLLKLPGVQIETGSYVGTGTHGASNPNSLTFGFVPKLVFIQLALYGVVSWSIMMNGVQNTARNSSIGDFNQSFSENTVEWYANTADLQLNSSGGNYIYIAIG